MQFGVGEYKDTTDSFTYRTNTALTANTAAVTSGINLWSASGGGDFPEGNLVGLERVADETAWRAGSTRVVVMFGDAPGHDPREGSTELSAVAALNDKGITVQIGNTAGTSLSGMNSAVDGKPAGQANRIAAATGGEVFTLSSSGAGIADLIKDAVDATFAEYDSVSLSPLGAAPGVGVTVSDPILGSFDREETRTFDFDVTFTGLEEGTHDFVIHALVDGGIVATETDSIVVGEGGEPGPGPGRDLAPDPRRSRCPRVCRSCSARSAVLVSRAVAAGPEGRPARAGGHRRGEGGLLSPRFLSRVFHVVPPGSGR